MTITTQQDQLFRETVFPSNAARQVQPIVQNLLNQRECLLRYDPPDADSQVAAALEWFETYADAANRKPQKWIDRPYISATERLPGIWRLVTVRTASEEGEDPGIYLLLREGWATSLLQSEARFASVQGSYATGSLSFTRYWPNIDPSKVVELTAALNATASVTNPVLNGIAQSGTFASSAVSGQIMEGDGAGIISQTLTQYAALSQAGDPLSWSDGLAARRYLKTNDHQILEAFNLADGAMDSLAYIFKNLAPSDESTVMNTSTLTDAALRKTFSLSGYAIVDRKFQKEEDGTGTFSFAAQLMTWNTWTSGLSGYDLIEYEAKDRAGEVRRKQWLSIRNADLNTARTYLLANADTDFRVLRVDCQNIGDGRLHFVQTTVKKITELANQTNSLDSIRVLGLHGWQTVTVNGKLSVLSNFTKTEAAGVSDSIPSGYSLAEKTPRLIEGGLYEILYRYEQLAVRQWGKTSSGSTSYSPDFVEYDGAGTSNDRPGKTETWTMVRIADAATAESNCRTGTNATIESGYVVDSVVVTGGGEGYCSIVRRSKKQINGISTAQGVALDPHSIKVGSKARTTIRYEHFTKDAIEDLGTGYVAGSLSGSDLVISNEIDGPVGDGWYDRTIILEQVTRHTWDNTETADYTDYPNAGTDREGMRRVWVGIEIGDIQSAIEDVRTGTGAGCAAPDGYIISGASASPSGEGACAVTQALVKQINGIDVLGSKLIDPFAFQEGVQSTTVTKYENFTESDILDAAIGNPENKAPGTDAGVISNQQEGPDANGLYSRTIVEETVTWTAWITGEGEAAVIASPDITETLNPGTDRQGYRKTWFGIRQEDMDAALEDLKDGTVAAESGYVVTDASVRPGQLGSVILTQTQTKQINGISTSGTEAMALHGVRTGRKTITTTRYENFTQLTLPSPAGKVPGVNVGILANKEDGPDANGFYSRTIVEESTSWYSWSSIASTPDDTQYRNKGTTKEQKVRTWTGLQLADRQIALDALATPESGYTCSTVRLSPFADGAVAVTQTQGKIAKGSAGSGLEADHTRLINPHDMTVGTLYRTIVINEDLASPSDAYVTLSSSKTDYTLVDTEERLQGDGNWSVIAVYEKVVWPAFDFAAPDTNVDSFPEDIQNNVAPVTIREKRWNHVPASEKTTAKNYCWTHGDAGFLNDDVDEQNNGDGSVSLRQLSSKVDTGYSRTWDESHGWFWSIVYTGDVVVGRMRYDEMWRHTVKYFQNEYQAQVWTSESGAYKVHVGRITPSAWRAERRTKIANRVSGW